MTIDVDLRRLLGSSNTYEARMALLIELSRLHDYDRRLSAVMPPDFKDWHDNAKTEWPAIAADAIERWRKREGEAMADAERAWTLVSEAFRAKDKAQAEADRLRADLREAMALVNAHGEPPNYLTRDEALRWMSTWGGLLRKHKGFMPDMWREPKDGDQ